uniref:Uncharacterized protein n=1 Tax=Globodera rostochiensis TaxID=31243 RepID=A0A914GY41_GLORO
MHLLPGGGGGPLRFVHTCNGTGLASSRAMIALLETHQTGRQKGVKLPEVISRRMPTERMPGIRCTLLKGDSKYDFDEDDEKKRRERMGVRSSKLRQFYRKALHNKKALKSWRGSANDATVKLLAAGAEEEMTLLELFDEADDGDAVDEPPLRSADSATERRRWLDELDAMQRPIDTLAGALREQLAALETEHRQKLQHCAVGWQNALNSSSFCGISGRKRRKLESLTEECRLRSTLLAEKIRNCSDYLHSFDTLIRSIQREQKRKSEEDDFLREFLLKSARHQHKKGQIGQALDTFCQLLLATGGHLSAAEMEVLADVYREKVRQTREFHERISQAVRQVQLNESNSGRQNVVIQELWGQVLDDLRSECAESFEIVMQVKCDEDNTVGRSEPNCAQKHNTEQLKLLMASTVCALWLHITPREHEEFDDIKDLFFSTLDDYIETFRIDNQKNCVKNVADDLEKTVRELMGNYPTVAGTKKMRKIAQRILII